MTIKTVSGPLSKTDFGLDQDIEELYGSDLLRLEDMFSDGETEETVYTFDSFVSDLFSEDVQKEVYGSLFTKDYLNYLTQEIIGSEIHGEKPYQYLSGLIENEKKDGKIVYKDGGVFEYIDPALSDIEQAITHGHEVTHKYLMEVLGKEKGGKIDEDSVELLTGTGFLAMYELADEPLKEIAKDATKAWMERQIKRKYSTSTDGSSLPIVRYQDAAGNGDNENQYTPEERDKKLVGGLFNGILGAGEKLLRRTIKDLNFLDTYGPFNLNKLISDEPNLTNWIAYFPKYGVHRRHQED